MLDEPLIQPADETRDTVLNVPYNAACDLAEAIATACMQLRDPNGRRRPVIRNEATPYLVAAVQAISSIAKQTYSDVLIDLLPPGPVELQRMRLGKYGWGIWCAEATPENAEK